MKKFKPKHLFQPKIMALWGGLFAVIGLIALFFVNAATPVSIDSSIPDPTEVKAFADDRVATVSWRAPQDAESKGIIGYYVTWGSQNGGVYTNAKQTEYTDTQIQPLTNGTVYNVKVQSVKGTMVAKQITEAWDTSPQNPGIVYEGVASGKVSPGKTTTVTPSSARVDDLRSKMTAFFDDFNTPAGAFNELKWNNAPSACNQPGEVGAFVNSQFHAHSQVRSSCDRTLIVNRPRAVFDITGRTEANPGIIVADADGLISGRDVWYIDMIPVDARKDGSPIDITSRVDDGVVADPMMIRLHQNDTSLSFTYVDSNKVSHDISATYTCGGWNPNVSDMKNCTDVWEGGSTGRLNTSLSPLPLPLTTSNCPEWPFGGAQSQTHCPSVIPNLRRHWIIQVSDTKIKVFIDGYRVWEGIMPAEFANIKKYVIHNNVFSYNTGKENNNHPTTEIMLG